MCDPLNKDIYMRHLLYHRYGCMLVLICATVILEKTIRIPRSLSVKAAQVLKGLLNKVYNYMCMYVCTTQGRIQRGFGGFERTPLGT